MAETMLEALRARTRDHHARLEASLDLMDAALDLEAYRGLVARFYGFHAALEPRLAAAADWAAMGYDFEARRKLPMLARDLHALGLDPAALPLCDRLPPVDDVQAALGCMYVIEGSTLGGQQLSRHFADHLGLGPATGAAYFGSYGREVGPRWGAFRAFLAVHGRGEAAPEAAAATFEALAAWLAAEPVGAAST